MTLLRHNIRLHLLLIVVVLLATRILYLSSPSGQIGDADEAVFGMMAQKIEAGEEFPIYCWEAQYAGAPVSYIAAVIFHFFGSGFVQLRLAMLPFSLLTGILFYLIYCNMFNPSEALTGAFFLIFCPFLVLRYTMGALGGYGETYLGTAIIILVSWKIQKSRDIPSILYWVLLLGVICGFFFYVLFLVLPAIIAFAFPSIYVLRKRGGKLIGIFLLGSLIGVLPMVLHNIQEPGGTFVRAGSRSLSIGKEALQGPLINVVENILLKKTAYLKSWVTSAPKMLGCYVVPDVIGERALGFVGLALAIVLIWFVTLAFPRKEATGSSSTYVRQFAAFFVFLVVFQWVANLSRPRHMLPLLLIIPVALFTITKSRGLWRKSVVGILCLACGLQAIGWTKKMQKHFFDPKPIIELMEEKGITEFYGSYWTTYPIMFIAKSKLIGSPYLLPHNEILSDRRPDYTKRVNSSPSPAFVFASDEQDLKRQFQQFLKKHKISAKHAEAQGGTIFYDFSKPVRPIVKSRWKTGFIVAQNYPDTGDSYR